MKDFIWRSSVDMKDPSSQMSCPFPPTPLTMPAPSAHTPLKTKLIQFLNPWSLDSITFISNLYFKTLFGETLTLTVWIKFDKQMFKLHNQKKFMFLYKSRLEIARIWLVQLLCTDGTWLWHAPNSCCIFCRQMSCNVVYQFFIRVNIICNLLSNIIKCALIHGGIKLN